MSDSGSDLSSDLEISPDDAVSAQQPRADSASLAAAVAAVDNAAEAALEGGAAYELPFLPEDATDGATAFLQATPAVAALQTGISTLQTGIFSMATAVKDLLSPDQAPNSPELIRPEFTGPDLTEVSVVATASTAGLLQQSDPIGQTAEPAPDASQSVHVELQSAMAGEAAFARQRSRTERRPKLLLLCNQMLMPVPPAALQQQGATAPPLSDSKQQIADALKPSNSVSAGTAPKSSAITAAVGGVVSTLTRAKTANKATFAALDLEPVSGAVVKSNLHKASNAAEPNTVSSIASIRHSEVLLTDGSKQHSPAARSKSFSPGSAADPVRDPKRGSGDPSAGAKGGISPSAASVTSQAFSKAARSQIRQHVEKSAVSHSAQSSTGVLSADLKPMCSSSIWSSAGMQQPCSGLQSLP